MRRPQVLLADLDGTLIDTMPILADLASEVMNEVYACAPKLARTMYLDTCGLPFSQQLEVIYPGDGRNCTAAERFESRKPARCAEVSLLADTRAALEALRALGTRIVVSSNNGRDNVENFARRSGFAFDMVLGFGDGLCKGGPHVRRAAQAFGAGPEEMLFVGDSIHDGDMARREGIAFVAIAGTFPRRRFTERFPGAPVVRHFAELPALLG